jgi:hypothetical protein
MKRKNYLIRIVLQQTINEELNSRSYCYRIYGKVYKIITAFIYLCEYVLKNVSTSLTSKKSIVVHVITL